MKARRLDTRSINLLPVWNQENASSSQRWKTVADLFNDRSTLSVPETASWLDLWRNLWDLKLENEGGNFFSFDAAIDGWGEPQLLWCRKLQMFAFSHNFIWILQERVVAVLLRGLHCSCWGNLYFCGLRLSRYLSVQCLLSSACWLLFFLHYDS